MKLKVSEATNNQLDWLVAKCLGNINSFGRVLSLARWEPTADPAQGQPLIERFQIATLPPDGHRYGAWQAFLYNPSQHDLTFEDAVSYRQVGQTQLSAAMRCLVASELGLEVEVPDGLA